MTIAVVQNKRGWEITFDGSTEWDITSATLNGHDSKARTLGVPVRSLEVIPFNTDDIFAIRDGGSAGRRIMNVKAADARDERIKYFNRNVEDMRTYELYVVASEVTSGVILMIEF